MKNVIKIILISLLLTGAELAAAGSLSQAGTANDGGCFSTGDLIPVSKPGQQRVKIVSVQHGLIAAEEDLSGVFSWPDAKVSCDSLKIHGYKDWYLPDKNELNKLFVSKRILGGFSDTRYWNATQNDEQNAWVQDFLIGSQNSCNKGAILHVRPVRKF